MIPEHRRGPNPSRPARRATVRRVASAMALLAGVTMLLLVGVEPSDAPSAPADAATSWSLRSGIGSAILQASPDTGVERVAPPKLRPLLLVGGLGMAALAMARAVGRAPVLAEIALRRPAYLRVPLQRGPPSLGPAAP